MPEEPFCGTGKSVNNPEAQTDVGQRRGQPKGAHTQICDKYNSKMAN